MWPTAQFQWEKWNKLLSDTLVEACLLESQKMAMLDPYTLHCLPVPQKSGKINILGIAHYRDIFILECL